MVCTRSIPCLTWSVLMEEPLKLTPLAVTWGRSGKPGTAWRACEDRELTASSAFVALPVMVGAGAVPPPLLVEAGAAVRPGVHWPQSEA